MAIYKSEKYVWNATTNTWDLYFDKTSADIIVETSTAKVLTAEERLKISNNLTTFNVADKLVKLNSSGKIPDGLINQDFADYLKRDGTLAMTGNLNMGGKQITNSQGISHSSGGSIGFTGVTIDLTPPSGGLIGVNGNVDYRGSKAVNLADPTNPQDGANKRWVEQLVSQGTHIIAAVRAATTGNVASLSGLITVDGVVLDEGDRVLVRLQTTSAENGVYIVNSGAWTKLPNDSDKGSLVSVLEGTTQRRHQYYNQDGTGWDLYWVDDDYHATVNGGLELDSSGLGFGIKAGGVTNAMLAGNINVIDKLANFVIPNSWYEDYEWGYATTGISTSLINALGHFAGMIKTLRGTTTPHEDNDQTIADAYSKIELKNSVRYGDNVPDGNPNGVDGDIFLKRLT